MTGIDSSRRRRPSSRATRRSATAPTRCLAQVEEKTHRQIRITEVASLALAEIRGGGPARVAERLRDVRGGQPVVVNALDYQDL